MKTPLLPVAGVVLGIAIGFVAGKAGGGKAREEEGEARRSGSSARLQSSRPASAGGPRGDSTGEAALSALLKGRAPSELSAEEAYKLMLPQLNMDWHGDPLEQARVNYQFQLLMSKLPLRVLEDVMALGREGGVQPFRINQVFGAYASRDWDKAMAWAGKQPDADNLRATAIARLAQTDPARASDLYQQELLTGASRTASWETSFSLASSYARQGQAAFFNFVDTMPSATVSNMISNAARTIPKEDIPAFLAQIQKRTADGKLESWTLNNLMNNIATTHPEEARNWVAGMEPGEKRAEAEMSLASSLNRSGKTDEADALVKSAMESAAGKEKEFVKARAGNLMGQSPELVEKLVNMLPEGQELTREDVKHWQNYGYGRTDAVLDVAKFIHSPEEQAAYLVESFNGMADNQGGRKMNAKDFEILSHRLGTLGLTGDAAAQARTALDSAREKALGK